MTVKICTILNNKNLIGIKKACFCWNKIVGKDYTAGEKRRSHRLLYYECILSTDIKYNHCTKVCYYMNIRAYIDTTDFFAGISEKGKELLADICIPKKIDKKDTLFHEGDTGHAFYLVGGGTIGLYKGAEDGREVVIKMVHRGEIFAEVILFEQNRYPVTAVALKPSLVFIIPKAQFSCLLADEQFRTDFMRMLMRKQRYLAERIKFLTMNDVEDRFFLFIKEHYSSTQNFTLTYSKKDIAAAIGTTPETYSRLITRLVREGRITIAGKVVTILK